MACSSPSFQGERNRLNLQMTSGKLTAIHAIVTLLAVWLHPRSALLLRDTVPFCDPLRLLPTKTLGLVRSGDEPVGAGVEVRDLRGEAFVGEASGGGKADGWLRVDTILAVAMFRISKEKAFALYKERGASLRKSNGVLLLCYMSRAGRLR